MADTQFSSTATASKKRSRDDDDVGLGEGFAYDARVGKVGLRTWDLDDLNFNADETDRKPVHPQETALPGRTTLCLTLRLHPRQPRTWRPTQPTRIPNMTATTSRRWCPSPEVRKISPCRLAMKTWSTTRPPSLSPPRSSSPASLLPQPDPRAAVHGKHACSRRTGFRPRSCHHRHGPASDRCKSAQA